MKEKNKRMKKTDTADDLKIVFESNRKNSVGKLKAKK